MTRIRLTLATWSEGIDRQIDRLLNRCPNCHCFRELEFDSALGMDRSHCPICDSERAEDVATFTRKAVSK